MRITRELCLCLPFVSVIPPIWSFEFLLSFVFVVLFCFFSCDGDPGDI